ncbi:MAG TPA: sugar transferase [Chloroflexota bacterium]|nr:sugar transferase [Chloroflexota bacterium]
MTVDQRVLTYASPLARPTPAGRAWRVRLPGRLLTLCLVVLDGSAILGAFALAYIVRFKMGIPVLAIPPHDLAFYSWVTYWAVPVWLVVFALYGTYDRRRLFAGFEEYVRVVHACTAGVIAVVVMSFLYNTSLISRGWLLLTWVLALLGVGGSRFVVRRVVRSLRARGVLTTRTLIVGTNEEGLALAEQFSADPGSGIRVVGVVAAGSESAMSPTDASPPVLGGLTDLRQIVDDWQVSEVVVAPTALTRGQLLELYRTLGQDDAVELRFSSGLFEILTTGIRVHEAGNVPLVTPQRVRITGLDAAIKSVLDYTVALAALLLLSPLLCVVALLIKCDSPGPVFHRRRVLGRSGRPFDAFKFRTMVVNADEVLARDAKLRAAFEGGFKLKDDPRVTRVGRWLRRLSIDELPQLINVVRGEMSLVGPRMIVPDEAARYGKWQLNLLTVKPGITGPWQVRGRSDIRYEDRIRLSMDYIRNYSIWLDLEILLRTVPAILQGTGAY